MDEIDREAIIHVYGEELLWHAYWQATSNRQAMKDSYVCACVHCGNFFFPEEIKHWTPNGSAVCPLCGWIAVLPDSAHLPLTPGYLAEMKKRWCRPS